MANAGWVLLAGAAAGGLWLAVGGEGGRAAEPQRKLRHVVMYKFKDGLEPARIQEVVDAFSQLPGKIDAIIGFEKGTNVSVENKSEGFTHVFVVTFKDEKGRDGYLKHPAHEAYVAVVKDKREKVIVFDYWTTN